MKIHKHIIRHKHTIKHKHKIRRKHTIKDITIKRDITIKQLYTDCLKVVVRNCGNFGTSFVVKKNNTLVRNA